MGLLLLPWDKANGPAALAGPSLRVGRGVTHAPVGEGIVPLGRSVFLLVRKDFYPSATDDAVPAPSPQHIFQATASALSSWPLVYRPMLNGLQVLLDKLLLHAH